jgi:hypothetical protein
MPWLVRQEKVMHVGGLLRAFGWGKKRKRYDNYAADEGDFSSRWCALCHFI